MTRMVGTGEAPQGYHEGQVFDVRDGDEGTVEDLERKGWARRLDPYDDPGRDKVSIANAMVRNDPITDPHDRAIAREIGSHDNALAIVHNEDPDATPEDYENEADLGRTRDALGAPLEAEKRAVLDSEGERVRSGGTSWGGGEKKGKAQNDQDRSAEGDAGDEDESGPDATDAAKELAAEHGIDLSQVEGTGTDGRITQPDVEKYIEAEGS